jgi:hypothetical protein
VTTTQLGPLQTLGRCRTMADNRFLIDDPDQRAADPVIQAVCTRCPVSTDCLAFALENEEEDGEAGVWGGTTPYQRRQLKRTQPRVFCPGCSSDAVSPTARGEVCLSCGVSWLA